MPFVAQPPFLQFWAINSVVIVPGNPVPVVDAVAAATLPIEAAMLDF